IIIILVNNKPIIYIHYLYFTFFLCYPDHTNLHPFPTRRSSDLWLRFINIRWFCTLPTAAGTAPMPVFWLMANPNRASALNRRPRSEEHTSELQSRENLVCRLLLEKKKKKKNKPNIPKNNKTKIT